MPTDDLYRQALQDHPLQQALEANLCLSAEVPTDLSFIESGWTTAEAFRDCDAAIDEYLAYQGSFNAGTDARSRATFLMADYAYIFCLAVVPVFVGSDILPDIAARSMALHFYMTDHHHDGVTQTVRRARVRFLSPLFTTSRTDLRHGDAHHVSGHPQLCDLFRQELEGHFAPLIQKLHAHSGLARSAFWRLLGDAVASRFLDTGRQLGCAAQAQASAMLILKTPGSPLANRQLGYFDVVVHDDTGTEKGRWTFRARGGCCRYYTVERGELCATCVLRDKRDRDTMLADLVRRHLSLASPGAI
ncbi:siderophore biosynthesis protein [Azorhizobium oxalatiphilum]|uniref:Siderophore biosynthesis protein n=1 Tax=Azorhizobium oxalatiphilum TaxID=980631 RepID=A0A917C7V3_9HYPH|nr:(2Fe-2S)-binding protein [Azorhizobium oxalatiphilum]GGF74690.1 siderophore biosynthesis protein [Azorhizobium oxalatiphilum]